MASMGPGAMYLGIAWVPIMDLVYVTRYADTSRTPDPGGDSVSRAVGGE